MTTTTGQMTRNVRLFVAGMSLLLACTFGLMLWVAREQSLSLVVMQIEKNATAVGSSLSAQIKRPIEYGFLMERLVGVEEVFKEELSNNKALSFFALREMNGKLLTLIVRDSKDLPAIRKAIESHDNSAAYRMVTLSIGQEHRLGDLIVGYPMDYIDRQLGSIVIDLVLAVIIAFVVVREIGRAFWEKNALRQLTEYESFVKKLRSGRFESLAVIKAKLSLLRDQIGGRLSGTGVADDSVSEKLLSIRLIIFLVALSEELIRPFFVVFASEVRPSIDGLSPTMLAGIPVFAFMLALAAVQPIGPSLADRFDLRKCFIATSAFAGVLLACTGYVGDGFTLAVLRGLTGAGYGLMLILGQLAVMRITDARSRAGGLVEISAAIVAAGIVGPAFGGILNDRFGSVAAFMVCGGLYFLAAVLAFNLPAFAKSSVVGASHVGLKAMAHVLSNLRVLSVILFAAIPARLAAATLLVVVVPLYLRELNEPASIVGRVLLLYFLAFMVTAPFAARLSDKMGKRKPFVIVGCALSAFACGAVALSGLIGTAVACACLGIAQAILSAPQLAIVTEVMESPEQKAIPGSPSAAQGLATFRFIERVGSIAAPFVAAAAVAGFGLQGSIGVIGLILAVGAVGVFAGLFTFKEVRN